MDKNRRTAGIVVLVVSGMLGLSYAAVPLYETFCRVTGWGGTTQQTAAFSDTVLDRKITVHIGESGLAFYEATNTTDEPIVGTASFNVQPAKTGVYFMKVECFCFQEQLLKPGESMKMPVTYYIDPEMVKNDRLDEVREITLSYTFYRNEVAEQRMRTASLQ